MKNQPIVQNTINYCPCCGTNLRAINLALSFATARANPRPANPEASSGNGDHESHGGGGNGEADTRQRLGGAELKARNEKILALKAKGLKPAEIIAETGYTPSGVRNVYYIQGKGVGPDRPRGRPVATTPTEMGAKILALRAQGKKPKEIEELTGASDASINYWLYGKKSLARKSKKAVTA